MPIPDVFPSVSQEFGAISIPGNGNIVSQGIHIGPEHPKSGYFLVPRSPNRLFIGRDAALQQLSSLVKSECEKNVHQTRIAITGLGGLGKSELCLNLIEVVRESFENVFWIDVGSDQAAEQGFMGISNHLKLELQDFQQVVQYLSGTRQTWLLVLDNADDPAKDFSQFFPSGSRGTVIITSRNPECGQKYGRDHWEQLAVLAHSSSTDLLMRAANYEAYSTERKHAERIVETLGCHTLAIVLAGSYIADELCDFDEYLDIYEKNWQKVMKNYEFSQEKSRYSTVFATFEASMAVLEAERSETSSDALEILDILSALSASNVPVALFKEAWESIPRIAEIEDADKLESLSDWHVRRLPVFLQATVADWDWCRVTSACNRLKALSIITTSGRGPARKLTMHTIAHDWLWQRQTPQKMEGSWISTGSALSMTLLFNRKGYVHVNEYRSHLGYYIAAWLKFKLCPASDLSVLQIIYHCTVALDAIRDDRLALRCLDAISSAHREYNEDKEMRHLGFYELHARSRLRNGDPKGSIRMWVQILSLQERLAEDHPSQLASQHELAGAYEANGQVKQATALLEHIVKVEEGSLAEDHPSRLALQHALARAYQADEQIERSQVLLRLLEAD